MCQIDINLGSAEVPLSIQRPVGSRRRRQLAALCHPYCYTDASVARVLHISPAEVVKRQVHNDLLALAAADGDVEYPSIQVRDGDVVPHLRGSEPRSVIRGRGHYG